MFTLYSHLKPHKKNMRKHFSLFPSVSSRKKDGIRKFEKNKRHEGAQSNERRQRVYVARRDIASLRTPSKSVPDCIIERE